MDTPLWLMVSAIYPTMGVGVNGPGKRERVSARRYHRSRDDPMTTQNLQIAYFVSPHGFGHAARAAAVIGALHDLLPSLHVDVFTSVPSWFFEDSLRGPWTYHPLVTDVGLVQESPLHADLPGTIEQLDRFLPFPHDQIVGLGRELRRWGCRLVVCDIAPLGIAAALQASLPSVLVENFTWDWVYEEYTTEHHRLKGHADYLGAVFRNADYHIQTEPVCQPQRVDLTVAPVSRATRHPVSKVRKQLGVPQGACMVLLTMGGVRGEHRDMERLSLPKDVWVVVPGWERGTNLPANVIPLPHRSPFFHPDLVSASDAVVGKVGYSTVAEVYHAGVPFGFIKRWRFKESELLAGYVTREMKGTAVHERSLETGEWIGVIPQLLAMPRIQRTGPNGATQVAAFIRELL